MMMSIKSVVLLCMLAVITSACASFNSGTTGENPEPSQPLIPFTVDAEVTVTGTVTGKIEDCAFDGICALVLDVDGEEVNAIWAEGMLRCEGQYQDGIEAGEVVEASGIARDANSLSICPSSDYYIRRAE